MACDKTTAASQRKKRNPQRIWRSIGAVALGIAALMVWNGVNTVGLPAVVFWLYWAVMLTALLVALVVAWIDVRYIRLQYLLERRAIFLQTLGHPEFRSQLLHSTTAVENIPAGEKPRSDA
jgi:membrane protein YdbS with pleckstrin-like domain